MKIVSILFCVLISFALSAQSNYNLNLIGQRSYTQDLNDIWGWVSPAGVEYALVGTVTGTSFVSLSNPALPLEVQFIPGSNSVWRDLKTWNDYAYVTCDQGNDGLLIVELNNLPGAVNFINWRPVLTINGVTDTFKRAHNIYIDENGIAYIAGSNIGAGEPFMLDLNTNPWVPVLIGFVPPIYAHDVYARGDTLWTSDIYDGVFSGYDISNKANPVFLGNHLTPYVFTHNTWLSDDSKSIFTTDEVAGAYIGSYDISDPSDIKELDRWRPFETQNVIPHNVHVLNDFIVISYYTDGIIVLDGSRPDNLVEVGRYDTYPQTGGGFNGCWGAYPFLPSGLVLASDMQNGLVVLDPGYQRACWLEGLISDTITGQPIFDVLVEIGNTSTFDNSKLTGIYKTGYGISGTYPVTFSKVGYESKTLNITLQNGVVTLQDVELMPLTAFSFSGTVVDADNANAPLANAKVELQSGAYSYTATTNATGQFTIPSMFADSYEIYAGKWGYKTVLVSQNVNQGTSSPTIPLHRGYRDEFALDLGWTIGGNATGGLWERAIPQGVSFANQPIAPYADLSFDIGYQCYVSGNNDNGSADVDDIDNGTILLTSPIFDLSTYSEPYLSYHPWFVNVGGSGSSNDSMLIRLHNGSTQVVLAVYDSPVAAWRPMENFKISDYITPTATMWLVVEAFDKNPGHLVEAAIDLFEVVDSAANPPTTVPSLQADTWGLRAYPNPSSSVFQVEFILPSGFSSDLPEHLQVFNSLGQLVEERLVRNYQVIHQLGQNWPTGLYWLRIGEKSLPLLKL